MKHWTSVCALAVALAAPSATAQDEQTLLGGDLVFQLPIGDWSDATGPQLGALLKFELPATPNLGVTARTGFLYGLTKSRDDFPGSRSEVGVSDIPFWVGARYYFMEPQDGLHAGLEAGLNYLLVRRKQELEFTPVGPRTYDSSDSEAKFGVGLGAGYRLTLIDVRAGLNILDLGHAGDSMGVMITVGYDFAQF